MYYPVVNFDEVISTFWNPLDAVFPATQTVHNLRVDLAENFSGAVPAAVLDTYFAPSSGKFYFELLVEEVNENGSNAGLTVGLRNVFDGLSYNNATGGSSSGSRINFQPFGENQASPTIVWASQVPSGNNTFASGNIQPTVDATNDFGFESGDRLMFAIDTDNSLGFLGKNGSWMNSANPATGTNPQWDWSNIITTQSAFKWRFFYTAPFAAMAAFPARFKLATGNNLYPQAYSAPSGFTAFRAPASAAFYGGFNLRQATLNGGGSAAMQHQQADWADGLPWSDWADNGLVIIGQSGFSSSQGLIHPGEKVYWEARSHVASSAASGAGIIQYNYDAITNSLIDSASPYCTWKGDGTLLASAGITIDSTGVASYNTTDIVGFHFDRPAGKLWLTKNNTFFNSGNPATGANPQFSGLPTDINLAAMIHFINTSRHGLVFASPTSQTYTPVAGFTAGLKIIEAYTS